MEQWNIYQDDNFHTWDVTGVSVNFLQLNLKRSILRELDVNMNNTLLPGYNRPVSEARIVDKELLKTAQQLARKHEGWAFANAVLREAYGK